LYSEPTLQICALRVGGWQATVDSNYNQTIGQLKDVIERRNGWEVLSRTSEIPCSFFVCRIFLAQCPWI
jgi:hypothetical protein